MSRSTAASTVLAFVLTLAAVPFPAPIAAGPALLLAQSGTEIGPGSRVRVDAPRYGLRSQTAVVREVGGGGLLLAFGQGATLHVEGDAMRRLDLYAGAGNHGATGFFLGVTGGAVAGVVSGIVSGDDPPCEQSSGAGFDALFEGLAHAFCEEGRQSAGEKVGQRAVLYGLAAGSIGLLIGRSIDVERWTEVDVGSTTFTVQPTVAGSGAGFVVSLPTGSP